MIKLKYKARIEPILEEKRPKSRSREYKTDAAMSFIFSDDIRRWYGIQSNLKRKC